MDIGKFGEFKTGQLLPIGTVGKTQEYAFVPNQLDPKWHPDPSLWPLIATVPARIVADVDYPDDAALRTALAASPAETVHFELRSGE